VRGSLLVKMITVGLRLIEDLLFISELVQIVTKFAEIVGLRPDERFLSVK